MITPPSTIKRVGKTPRHPVVDLLGRYRTIFRTAWDRRHDLAGPRLMLDERAFLPAALALQDTPPHPAPRRAIFAICTLFTVGLVWACFGQIDIVAVAQGRIIVSQRSKTIQPLESGVIKAIHVKDGDKVNTGDLLVELDSTLATADLARIGEERNAVMSEVMRSRALLAALADGGAPRIESMAPIDLRAVDIANAQIQLQAEWADITAKLAKVEAEIARRKAEVLTAAQLVAKLQTTLPLALQREKDFRALIEQGFVANHTGQDRTRDRIELERDLAIGQARLEEVKAALTETERGLIAYRAETQRSLKDREFQASLKIRQLAEEGAKAKRRNELTRLTAPVAGTVQQLTVHTTGGVVTPAQVLLVLVPSDSDAFAEVELENKDIGFVQLNQVAMIKLETFPYTRYGTVEAKIQSISADAVQDEKRGAIFPASLALVDSTINIDGKHIKLMPGMNLTAEIRTGKQRLIEYLLSPVRRHLDSSLRER